MSRKRASDKIYVTSLERWQDDEQAFFLAGEALDLFRAAGLKPGEFPQILVGAEVFFQFWACMEGLVSYTNPYCGSFNNIPDMIDFVAGYAPPEWVQALRAVQEAASGMPHDSAMPEDESEQARFMPPVIVGPILDAPLTVLKQAADHLRAHCPIAIVDREEDTTANMFARR